MHRRLLLVTIAASILHTSAAGAALARPWSTAVADTFLQRFPDPDSIHWVGQTNHFSWQAGYAMFTLEKLWRLTGDARYFNYIKRYVDQQVDEQGNIPDFMPTALDNFLPGYAILFMYEQTGLEKYRIAATRIRDGFRRLPAQCGRRVLARRLGEAPDVGGRCLHGPDVSGAIWTHRSAIAMPPSPRLPSK